MSTLFIILKAHSIQEIFYKCERIPLGSLHPY